MPVVHRQYFEPEHEAFKSRTLWSLSNAFTSAFKELKPVKQFQVTAKLGDFLEAYAARNNNVLILNAAVAYSSGTLAYATQAIDITDDFIAEYNKANPVPGASAPARSANTGPARPKGQ